MIVGLLWLAVILLLGLKVIATLILLGRPPEARLATRQGRRLWWATKITPILAVPCLILVAWIEQDRAGLVVYPLLMAFVLVAVPIMVWRRFGRTA
ncbi:hypothetical protein HZY97_13485 [Sphingomonas sp. R-74633]|uniref:hypothetical protein n=1 Tax=Sphingomonas sp. R-74633 TaxID=2751188 RepID=UPI0015D3573A|nr:hypothetical protein [Sphingomonas sp. R-74633]NYT41778.1 hypothetical protein [Sphingomonas sp. R-74633]